jgi:hypothetical protein
VKGRILLLAALLAGCASAPRYPAGRALLEGVTPEFPKPPDSLRAELELTAFAGGRKSSLSAAFSAKPRAAYKLDLFGLPGMVAGGFLWNPDGWDLVLFDRGEYVEGDGEHVEIGNLGLREIPVHDVFSWLWGDYFPGDSARAGLPEGWARAADGSFGYRAGGMAWRVDLDPKTGLPRSAARADSAFRIEFDGWRMSKGSGAKGPQPKGLAGERPTPRMVRFYRYREPLLEIKVKSLEDDPHWRRNPFAIKIPNGFRRLERMRD